MTEEYIYEREREFLDYIRNTIADPAGRGTNIIDESFTATAGQTDFTLAHTLVKNVTDIITINGSNLYKGQDYYVSYGEGNALSVLTLRVACTGGETLLVSYHYGESLVEREFSRTDVTLPRVVMMFLTGSEEFAGLGDDMEFGKGTYFNASYRFEVRALYALQARTLASQCFNLGMKMRHANLFRVIRTQSTDMQNFDYDNEKACYVWQFTIDIQWDLLFQ